MEHPVHPVQPRRGRTLPAAALALAVLTGGGLLAGCQNREQQAERERQEQAQKAAAEQRRQLEALVERCRAGQAELVKAADDLAATETALAELDQRSYRPRAQPQAPDPAVLKRYTISDQELELERHQQALKAWKQEEQRRRWGWEAEQRQERQRLEARLQQQRQTLAKANPAVLGPEPKAALNAEALAAYRSCKPETLASLRRP